MLLLIYININFGIITFGTFMFPYIGNFSITVTQSIIFQRAWWLNHQPWPGLKADPWRLGKLRGRSKTGGFP